MDGAIKDLDSWKFILKVRMLKNVMGVSCTHTDLLEQGNCVSIWQEQLVRRMKPMHFRFPVE
jgi:tRNA(Ser,Leu) C12 N-acetylase TAN1